MRKVIYTSIVGGYDPLLQPDVIDESFDYICFSNDFQQKKIGAWTIRRIPFRCEDKTVLSRYVKLLPHKVLPEYDWSLWIDSNIEIKGQEFYDAVNAAIDRNALIAQLDHVACDCVYEEIARCYRNLRIGFAEGHAQMHRLENRGFPHHFGLMENNIILRHHNDETVSAISEEWWNEFRNGPHRDQLCLMPIYWKNGFFPEYLFRKGLNSRNVSFLEYHLHPGTVAANSEKGLKRLKLKARWTFRRFMSKFL